MKSGGYERLGLGNGPHTVATSRNSDNLHSVQGYFYKFIMEVRIAVMVTKKVNV